jgi:hypothetical protein
MKMVTDGCVKYDFFNTLRSHWSMKWFSSSMGPTGVARNLNDGIVHANVRSMRSDFDSAGRGQSDQVGL